MIIVGLRAAPPTTELVHISDFLDDKVPKSEKEWVGQMLIDNKRNGKLSGAVSTPCRQSDRGDKECSGYYKFQSSSPLNWDESQSNLRRTLADEFDFLRRNPDAQEAYIEHSRLTWSKKLSRCAGDDTGGDCICVHCMSSIENFTREFVESKFCYPLGA